ncbi:GL27137 [Drosophila persimilis]|uniref:GL27137 n=1 Tax=Drosophila persimilis TaxID=7234 RepID=B4GZD8_DROPE|nr:GL27137 [Drosophila persimilis]
MAGCPFGRTPGLTPDARRLRREVRAGRDTGRSKGIGSRFEEQRLTLRIHRGRGSNQHDSMHSNGSTQSTTTTLGTPSPERLSKYATRRPSPPPRQDQDLRVLSIHREHPRADPRRLRP